MSEKAITLVLKQSDIFYKINICEGYLKWSDYIKKECIFSILFSFFDG
jgi:predicted nucleic acid binding AN1-type Zn finger protein